MAESTSPRSRCPDKYAAWSEYDASRDGKRHLRARGFLGAGQADEGSRSEELESHKSYRPASGEQRREHPPLRGLAGRNRLVAAQTARLIRPDSAVRQVRRRVHPEERGAGACTRAARGARDRGTSACAGGRQRSRRCCLTCRKVAAPGGLAPFVDEACANVRVNEALRR